MAAEMLHEQQQQQQQQQAAPQRTHQQSDIAIDVAAAAAEKSSQRNILEIPTKKTPLQPCVPGPPASRPRTPPDIVENREKSRLDIPSSALSVNDFELLKTLGTGTFARVWLVRLLKYRDLEKRPFALKVLHKADVIKLKQVEHVRNEIKTLAAVAGHPFITTLIATFTDDLSLYMLLEYCPGGEIFTFLRRARRFTEPTAQFYAAEIVLILEFLHDVHGVAYRDLKPENILLDADGHLKLVDFGFAKEIWSRETYTLCGTPEYLAPEVIHNSGHGLAVDWWALGVLIYEFIVGQPPFWDPNPMRIYEQIVEGRLRFPANMPPAAQDIVSQLCKTNPSERLGHIRGGSARVKQHPFFKGVNWDDIYHRRMKGPIVPRVDSPTDAGNFEDYPDPPDPSQLTPYTKEMRDSHEDMFKNF
ncbi:AGC/PKA protein kinase [Blastomyces dermatitidis ER-3]|uniref:cAMP-dependent protein kinase n=2 Tax=Blastomyces TaxID=229219 RepID=A0A179UA72_BLAGS|nr:AGC/PKA protein kinase [Blastomyces gilchristii SLH14081]XP_045276039.1 AGC/PKA protein kinase [Blastomyces dermatitidis ER-3]EEQ89032.1 AGC/PKA protein kinase [Blastomyces dermatitidis ER-3]OAT04623.1 AGC/PKA protein kinase [Blastomyces gilchristii SLH14081]